MGVTGPKERATFSLSADVKERLEEAVPKSERSRYVENAITRSLRDDARKALAKFLDELPKASATGENSTDFLRRKRLEWDGRPIDVLEGSSE
jgi:cytochrome c553